ncbi:MAG: hypothetical protein EB111_04435 [Actinobacteria bacterium]|nr:hypothetical protein [Actinomycetota bacterium]
MSNFLSSVLFLAVIGLLAWLGWGLEPHWSSKDGMRFMCRMQVHPQDPRDHARWHDVKVGVQDGELFVHSRSRRGKDARGVWRVIGAIDDHDRKRRIYELRSSNDDGASLRVPVRSRCVPVLDALVP